MKRAAFVFIGLFLAVPIFAQTNAVPTSFLGWDQPGPYTGNPQTNTYRYYPDGATTGTVLAGVTCTLIPNAVAPNPLYSCRAGFPAFTPGAHTLTLTAANAAGESAKSAVFAFTFVVVPGSPVGLRIE